MYILHLDTDLYFLHPNPDILWEQPIENMIRRL